MKWQPIETAPVGRTVLVWADYMDEPELANVWSKSLITRTDNERGSEFASLTHWMPLPAGPVEVPA